MHKIHTGNTMNAENGKKWSQHHSKIEQRPAIFKISACTLHKHTHAHTYRFESYSNTCICSLWSLYRLSYVSNLHCALSIQLLDFAWFLNWCLQIRFRHALTAHSTQSHRYSNSTYLHLYGIYIPICNYSYAVSVCVCEWKCVSFSFSLLTSWPIA